MKFVLKTDYVSNEFLDGTALTLVELSRDEARRILDLRPKAMNFLTDIGEDYGRVTLTFPGVMTVFDDYDGTIEAVRTLTDESFERLPDDFVLADGHQQGRIEAEQLIIHRDGDLWLKANADSSGDYLETSLPLSLIEQAAL